MVNQYNTQYRAELQLGVIFLPGLQLWVESERINVTSGRHPAGHGSNRWIGLCHVPSEARAFDRIVMYIPSISNLLTTL